MKNLCYNKKNKKDFAPRGAVCCSPNNTHINSIRNK